MASPDGIVVREFPSMKVVSRVTLHGARSEGDVIFSDDLRFFATLAARGARVSLWRAGDTTRRASLPLESWWQLHSYRFTDDNALLVSITSCTGSRHAHDTLSMFRLRDASVEHLCTVPIPQGQHAPLDVECSPDGRYCAFMTGSRIVVFESATGRIVLQLPARPAAYNPACVFLASPLRLAYTETPNTLRVRRIPDGTAEGVPILLCAVPMFPFIWFSPDERFCIVENYGDWIDLYSTRTGRLVTRLRQGESVFPWDDFAISIAFSPDGRHIATGRKGITVWNSL
jgi:hypothetical protein